MENDFSKHKIKFKELDPNDQKVFFRALEGIHAVRYKPQKVFTLDKVSMNLKIYYFRCQVGFNSITGVSLVYVIVYKYGDLCPIINDIVSSIEGGINHIKWNKENLPQIGKD